MRPLTTPTHAPDGMSNSGGQVQTRFTAERADGSQRATGADQFEGTVRDGDHDDFDDGLVHNHTWATATGK